MSQRISHSGVVKSVDAGCVKVRILQTSACASCKIASHCNASEMKVKVVDVYGADTAAYEVGQQVVVSTSRDVANRALLLGFGLPLAVLLLTLVVARLLDCDEATSALASLAMLVPYFLMVWVLRDRIRRSVTFRIE